MSSTTLKNEIVPSVNVNGGVANPEPNQSHSLRWSNMLCDELSAFVRDSRHEELNRAHIANVLHERDKVPNDEKHEHPAEVWVPGQHKNVLHERDRVPRKDMNKPSAMNIMTYIKNTSSLW